MVKLIGWLLYRIASLSPIRTRRPALNSKRCAAMYFDASVFPLVSAAA